MATGAPLCQDERDVRDDRTGRCARQVTGGATVLALLTGGASSGQTAAGTLTVETGQTLTATRAGTARRCTRYDGVLVQLAANTPCVELTGLSVQPGVTNLVTQSEALDNAYWTKTGATVTANGLAGPMGGTTMDKVDLEAVAGGENKSVSKDFSVSAFPYSASVYLRGVSGSGTIYLSMKAPNATWQTTACAYNATTVTRCKAENKTMTAGTATLHIGVRTEDAQQTAKAAQSVYVGGVQFEQSTGARGYVPTTGATASSSAEVITIPSTDFPTTRGSIGVTWTPMTTVPATGWYLLGTYGGAPANGWRIMVSDTGLQLDLRSSGNSLSTVNTITPAASATGLTWVPGTAYRIRATWGNGQAKLYRDGTLLATGGITGGVTANGAALHFKESSAGAGGTANIPAGWYHSVCVSTSSVACE